MIGSRYRVLGVCLFVIVVAPLQTEAQTITAACDVSTPPIWASVPALQKRLTDDGFRDVLEIYRTDLDRLSAAHEPWLERAQDWLNNICLPSLAAANAYQSNCRSALAAATPSCQSAHANAVRMEQEEQAAATTLNADYQDLENRLRGAIDRANEVLKPEVTEQMFTRLVARIHGKKPDCQTMAQLLGALGRRVDGDVRQMRTVAGRSFANAAPEGAAEFHQSGFRAPFVDPNPASNNQVRHFVAYFVVGMVAANTVAGDIGVMTQLAALEEQNQLQDYALGVVAAELGIDVGRSPALLKELESRVLASTCR